MSDRNLLFGVLALQLDFIGRDELLNAMNSWVLDKSRNLGDLLFEGGCISQSRLGLLNALVEEHLSEHKFDPEKSIAALAAGQEAVRDFEKSCLDANISSNNDPESTLPFMEESPVVMSNTRYRVVRLHAKGGLGEVFVAHDEELTREVAFKQIQREHSRDRVNQFRFLLEAEITGSLEHPGVAPVYGRGIQSDGRSFYTMRFIRGETLKEAIKEFHKLKSPIAHNLGFRQLVRRFIDVCNTLAYAHSRGVVHRDVKPANVILGTFGETLVVDWGLAKAQDREEILDDESREAENSVAIATRTGSVMGTPTFMSPEQADGRTDQVGPTSDVYSLGATFYELLTGRVPFEDRDVTVVLDKVRRGEFSPPAKVNPTVPSALNSICRRAMALRVEDRYSAATELKHDLERWLADEVPVAHRESWIEWTRRMARRFPDAATGIAFIAALDFAVFVVGISAWILGNQAGANETLPKSMVLFLAPILFLEGLSGATMIVALASELAGVVGAFLGLIVGIVSSIISKKPIGIYRCIRQGVFIAVPVGIIAAFIALGVLQWSMKLHQATGSYTVVDTAFYWGSIAVAILLPTLCLCLGIARSEHRWRGAMRGAISGGILTGALSLSYILVQALLVGISFQSRSIVTVTPTPEEASRTVVIDKPVLASDAPYNMQVRSIGPDRIYLNSLADYRQQGNVAVIIEREAIDRFRKDGVFDLYSHFMDKQISVSGKVVTTRNGAQILVSDPSKIQVIEKTEVLNPE